MSERLEKALDTLPDDGPIVPVNCGSCEERKRLEAEAERLREHPLPCRCGIHDCWNDGTCPACVELEKTMDTEDRLNRLVERLERRNVELSVQGYNWMVAHDKLKAGKSYDLPTTMDVPKLQAEVERLRTIVKNSPLPPGELRYRQLADGRVKDCVTGEVLEE
jgi:hypothetical protein